MTHSYFRWVSPCLVPLALGACAAGSRPARIEPQFITVSLQGELGTSDTPLPFSWDPVSFDATVQTLDENGDPYPFNGELTVRVRPGHLDMDDFVTTVDGQWSGRVSFDSAYGPTRIWFADEGSRSGDDDRTPGYATGVSEEIHFALPTIAELQHTTDIDTNALEGEFARIDVADHDVVVTAVGVDGFWVSDLDDGPGNGAGLYIYTFGKPTDVTEGSKVTLLSGSDSEYLGTTQISFPIYEIDSDTTLPIPDPVNIGETACSGSDTDDRAMELLESSLVAVDDVQIPSSFVPGSQDYADYETYGQWPISLGAGCTLYVDNSGLEDAFTPSAGMRIPHIEGMVAQVFSMWVILPRSADDLGIAANRRRPAPTGPARPRPRKAPR